jgi:gamma-glutamylputrescine oxidase
MASSYYRATLGPRVTWPALEGPVETRVCVVGGGFAGLNTALGLAERGVREVVLVEGGEVGHGASGRNGGFVFGGFSLGEAALQQKLGPQRARDLYAGTLQAVDLIRDRIRRYGIDCDPVDAGVVWANWFRDPEVLLSRQRLLAEHYGAEWEWLPREQLRRMIHSDRYGDGLFERRAFHFHPLKYVAGLADAAVAAGVALHEHTPAVALDRQESQWRVATPAGEILADQIVLACGGYLAGLRSRVDAGVMPIATYVMTTEPLGARMGEVMSTAAAVYDSRFAFDYYRPLPDSRLLWGGRISVRDRSPVAVERLLYRDMLKVFPQLDGVRIDHAWSGLMSYARHQMPQLGRIEPGLWLAQAFGGHGVAPTTFAGEVIAAAIAGDDGRWREFADFGLVSAWKPAGSAAAQLGYWWAEARDAWKDARERRLGR